jgi:ribA/ribD-fused uncharacterized protein
MHLNHIHDKPSLIEYIKQSNDPQQAGLPRLKYLYFWGHQPSPDGSITKTCCSQWFAAGFTVDQVQYPTAEHYMMAEKARLFNDQQTLQKILTAPHPHAAKALGREVQNFRPTLWEEQRCQIVVRGNLAKFSQNSPLRTFLIGTGDRILVEASPIDKIWGTGLAADQPEAERPDRWPGLNLLGFALMAVRRQLQEQD